jgi:hypothetical protein
MADVKDMADATLAEVEAIAHKWAADFVAERKARIDRMRLRATGSLRDSVKYELREPARMRWIIRVRYNYYGKFHDKGTKRPLPKGGRRYIELLTQWVLARGLANFTPRFRGPADKQARDIAWGIARSNARSTPWKRRKWLNPMRDDVNTLNSLIEKKLPEAIVQDVVKVLTL